MSTLPLTLLERVFIAGSAFRALPSGLHRSYQRLIHTSVDRFTDRPGIATVVWPLLTAAVILLPEWISIENLGEPQRQGGNTLDATLLTSLSMGPTLWLTVLYIGASALVWGSLLWRAAIDVRLDAALELDDRGHDLAWRNARLRVAGERILVAAIGVSLALSALTIWTRGDYHLLADSTSEGFLVRTILGLIVFAGNLYGLGILLARIVLANHAITDAVGGQSFLNITEHVHKVSIVSWHYISVVAVALWTVTYMSLFGYGTMEQSIESGIVISLLALPLYVLFLIDFVLRPIYRQHRILTAAKRAHLKAIDDRALGAIRDASTEGATRVLAEYDVIERLFPTWPVPQRRFRLLLTMGVGVGGLVTTTPKVVEITANLVTVFNG